MNITILGSEEGAHEARGIAVVIDVLRASSTIATILSREPEQLIAVADVEDALTLKSERDNCVVFGEKGGLVPEGFDYDNSPIKASTADLKGKCVVACTSNGTRVLSKVNKADYAWIGCFLNASAIVEEALRMDQKEIYLIPAGRGSNRSLEDDMCAMYLNEMLEWGKPDFDEIKKNLYLSDRAESYKMRKIMDDFEYCLTVDQVNVIPEAHQMGDYFYLKDRPKKKRSI